MSEHWKSTPKYWCKHCSTYVKDTKFERSQHEATGKHKGNLKRFLRDIQNSQEKSEREKQRAKAEVDRLNRVVGTSSAPTKHEGSFATKPGIPMPAPQTTAAERKKQVSQLAKLGVAIPDEFRGDMALAGEWKVVSQRVLDDNPPLESLSIGVRKRKHENQEDEEEEAGDAVAAKGWGSTTKRYPGGTMTENTDLDALLLRHVKNEQPQAPVKEELPDAHVDIFNETPAEVVKAEDAIPVEHTIPKLEDAGNSSGSPSTKPADAPIEPVFKKRKPRGMGAK